MELIENVLSFIASNDWIAWMLTALSLAYANHNNKKNNEMSRQPNFRFYPFAKNERIDHNSMAKLSKCGNSNCDKVHWLDVQNSGAFSAENVEIGIFKEEVEPVYQVDHWVKRCHLQSDDKMQISLTSSVSNDLLSGTNATLILLLKYRSPYTNYTYKRAYCMSLLKNQQAGNDPCIFLIDEYYKECSKLSARRILARMLVFVKKIAYILSNKPYDIHLWCQDI